MHRLNPHPETVIGQLFFDHSFHLVPESFHLAGSVSVLLG
jgi:hypothetical protein